MISNYIQSNQVTTLAAPLAASLTNLIAEADSGKILILPAQGFAQTFTLPLPKAGLCYKIIAGNTIGNPVTILTNPVNLFQGALINVSTANAAATPLIFTAVKVASPSVIINNTALIGAWVEMHCDGDFWFVNGLSATVQTTLANSGLQ